MIAWKLMIFAYLIGSAAGIVFLGWIGVLISILFYLMMSFTCHSTMVKSYKAFLWPVVIPDVLVTLNKPIPIEVHMAISKLMVDVPELRVPLNTLMGSYVLRNRICEKLPYSYPKGLSVHLINVLAKNDLIGEVDSKRLMTDAMCYDWNQVSHFKDE